MPKSRKLAPEYRRTTAEYVLIVIVVGLFLFGLWAYRAGNKVDEVIPPEVTVAPGTPDEVENITEQDVNAEQSSDQSQDEAEYASSSALEGAADSIGGVFDETSY